LFQSSLHGWNKKLLSIITRAGLLCLDEFLYDVGHDPEGPDPEYDDDEDFHHSLEVIEAQIHDQAEEVMQCAPPITEIDRDHLHRLQPINLANLEVILMACYRIKAYVYD
jgi:hypothetical protein